MTSDSRATVAQSAEKHFNAGYKTEMCQNTQCIATCGVWVLMLSHVRHWKYLVEDSGLVACPDKNVSEWSEQHDKEFKVLTWTSNTLYLIPGSICWMCWVFIWLLHIQGHIKAVKSQCFMLDSDTGLPLSCQHLPYAGWVVQLGCNFFYYSN